MWHLLMTHLCRRTKIKKKKSLVFLEFIFAQVKENLLQNSIIFLGVNAWDQKDFVLPSLIGGKDSGKQHRRLL